MLLIYLRRSMVGRSDPSKDYFHKHCLNWLSRSDMIPLKWVWRTSGCLSTSIIPAFTVLENSGLDCSCRHFPFFNFWELNQKTILKGLNTLFTWKCCSWFRWLSYSFSLWIKTWVCRESKTARSFSSSGITIITDAQSSKQGHLGQMHKSTSQRGTGWLLVWRITGFRGTEGLLSPWMAGFCLALEWAGRGCAESPECSLGNQQTLNSSSPLTWLLGMKELWQGSHAVSFCRGKTNHPGMVGLYYQTHSAQSPRIWSGHASSLITLNLTKPTVLYAKREKHFYLTNIHTDTFTHISNTISGIYKA